MEEGQQTPTDLKQETPDVGGISADHASASNVAESQDVPSRGTRQSQSRPRSIRVYEDMKNKELTTREYRNTRRLQRRIRQPFGCAQIPACAR
jgi:hypothetical protein